MLREDVMIRRWKKGGGRVPPGFRGIGDDCAWAPGPGQTSYAITTDLLLEGVHFLSAQAPEDVAQKAIAVNLSDLAAAGARPVALFLSIALPRAKAGKWFERFQKAFLRAAHAAGVVVLGGDTTGSRGPVFVNVTAVGTVPRGARRTGRQGARAGDVLAVTGTLGESALGLAVLRARGQRRRLSGSDRAWVMRYRRPQAEVAEGMWLARQKGVHAMMDLSDGLGVDARRLAEASGVRVVLEAARVREGACRPEMREACARRRVSVLETALFGGEDFRLLVAVSAQEFPRVSREFQRRFRKPLRGVGRVERGGPGQVLCGGRRLDLVQCGFDHFGKGL